MYLTRIVSNKFNIIVSQYWICIVSVLHKRKKITHLLAGVNYHLGIKTIKLHINGFGNFIFLCLDLK